MGKHFLIQIFLFFFYFLKNGSNDFGLILKV